LADVSLDRVPAGDLDDFRQALDDYLAAQQLNADDPAAQVNTGNLQRSRGEYTGAERSFREALRLDPNWVPACVNLSDLYRQMRRDAEGEKLLRECLTRLPKAAALHHSLGLLKARQQNLTAALASLKRATELAPRDARFSYVYAVALHSTGKIREARSAVAKGLQHVPGDPGLRQLRSQLAAPE
jgi:Flp pilus assembly protein TadD